jgi:hypothetical protein
VVKRGCFWLGVDQWGRQSFKEMDCDILTQSLIGLIEYSYHEGIFFFSESPTVKKSRVKHIFLEAVSGLVTDLKIFLDAHK